MTRKAIKILVVCLSVPAVLFLLANHLQLWFDETVQLFSAHSLSGVLLDAFRKGELTRLLKWPETWLVLAAVFPGLLLVFWLGYVPQMGGVMGLMKMEYLIMSYLNRSIKVVLALKDPMNLAALALFAYSVWRMLTGRNSYMELLHCTLFLTSLALSLKWNDSFGMRVDRCLAINVTFNLLLVEKLVGAMNRLLGGLRDGIGSFGGRTRPISLSLTLLGGVFSTAAVYDSFKHQGVGAFMSAMTSPNEKCFDSVVSALDDAAVIVDRAATPNIKAYSHFRRKPMPANEYVCDLPAPQNLQKKTRTVDDRMDFVLAWDFDYYCVPELYCYERMKSFERSSGAESVNCDLDPIKHRRRAQFVFGSKSGFYRNMGKSNQVGST